MNVTHKNEAVMIGDKKPDIVGGRENGIDTIGVLYGYGNLEEIQDSEPIHIAKNPLEIADIILK